MSYVTFGNPPSDLTKAIIPEELNALNNPITGKEVRVLIKDDNGLWVDFSDRAEGKGVNKLDDYGIYKHATEKRGGIPILESTIESVLFDNSDGFFDKVVTGLTSVDGTAAVFNTKTSYNVTETAWNEREIKFELWVTLRDNSIFPITLGVYLIKEIEGVSGSKRTVNFKLESKMNVLRSVDASIVKDGVNWYRNRKISFLVSELLKTKFTDENGNLPNGFYINKFDCIDIPEELGKAYSTFGVPPQDDENRNVSQSYIRAMDIWIWNIGTVASSSDYSYTLTSSSNWTTGSNLKPKVGDVIVIKSSSNGNDGSYEILTLDGTTVTLKQPLKGTTESGMSYTISRLYFVHKDRELWELIPETCTYNYIGDCDPISVGASPWVTSCGIAVRIIVNSNKLYLFYSSEFKHYISPALDTWAWFGDYLVVYYDGSSFSLLSSNALKPYSSSLHCAVGDNLNVGQARSGDESRETENLFLPFNQVIPYNLEEGPVSNYIDNHSSILSSTITTPDILVGGITDEFLPNFVPRGYWSIYGLVEGDFFYFKWDNAPRFQLIPDWGASGSIVSLELTSGNLALPIPSSNYEKIEVRIFDIASESYTDYTIVGPTIDNGGGNIDYFAHSGICLKYDRFKNQCILSVLWIINSPCNAANYDRSFYNYLYYINSSGTLSKIYGSVTGGNYYTTILDLSPYYYLFAGGEHVVDYLASVMNRDDLVNTYSLEKWRYSSATGNLTKVSTIMVSNSPFTSIVEGTVNADNGDYMDLLIFHKYENRILRFDSYNGVIYPEANGDEVVSDDGVISTPLIVDYDTRVDDIIIYGISWTGEDPTVLNGLKLPNKGLLWKLDSRITSNIELADFDSLNVGEAIGRLAQACNHIALFNSEGDFFFIPRDISEFDDYVFQHSGESSLVTGDIKKLRGFDEVYNHITMIPYRTKISEIDFELVLTKREDNEPNQDMKGTLEINSLNNLKRSLRLVCIDSGPVSGGMVLFKFLVTFEDVEARIVSELSSSSKVVLLGSVFGGDQVEEGIHTGDFIIFNHPDDDSVIYREIAGGYGIGNLLTTSGGTALVTVTDPSIYNVGDVVNINANVSGVYYRSKKIIDTIDGDEITFTTNFDWTITTASDILAPITSESNYISLFTSTGVTIPAGSEVTVVRLSSSDNANAQKSWSSDFVTFLTQDVTSSTTIYINNSKYIEEGCFLGIAELDVVQVTEVDHNLAKVTLASSVTASKGDQIKVFWCPSESEFRTIPQSGFEIKFSTGEVWFKQGDVIEITTDGLVLEEDSRSRKLAVSLTSKNRYGKLDYPTVKNRFLHSKLAEALSRELLDYYKHPRYQLELDIPLLPYINFTRGNRLATFKIISEIEFPRAKDFSRKFYLRSFSIDVKSEKMSLTLIDKDFY